MESSHNNRNPQQEKEECRKVSIQPISPRDEAKSKIAHRTLSVICY